MNTTITTASPAREVPGYAKICGIIALIFAIVGVLVPVVGVLYITPLAILFGAVGIYGGYKTMGIATLVVNVINLIISPTFWANIGAGATMASASGNRFLTYFDAMGVVAMFALIAWKRK